ncbi:lipase family protein [Dinoroseobacter sp. S76]|uniref:lipase family protein n=1 Tax=Dinoroseobacter sp. S76 TaxID=3415124 RepID=UPI003C7BA5E5
MAASRTSQARPDQAELLRLARLSERVYQLSGPVAVGDLFPDALQAHTVGQGAHFVRYTWIERPDEFIVAFRGSLRPGSSGPWLRSWALNFKAALQDIPVATNARVHRGFSDEARAAIDKLIGRIQGKPVLFCGHSQGGALALCSAVELLRRARARQATVLSFGQPRVGNRALCAHLDTTRKIPVHRIVGIGDGVTRLPQDLFGYDHCETPSYLAKAGGWTSEGRFPLNLFTTPRNHAMTAYLARLAAV